MRTPLATAGLALAILSAPALAQQGCPRLDTPIWAGQTIRSGLIVVTNSQGYLRLDCRGLYDWKIKAVHIYAGLTPVPTNQGGNPAPGQFPFKTDYNPPVDRHVEMIDIAALGARCGDTLYVAAHFEMQEIDPVTGAVLREETGWGHGKQTYTGSQWGWWEYYDLCCAGPGCGGSGLSLSASALRLGQSATLTATGANPGETVDFYYNSGEVVCEGGAASPAYGGMRFDLSGRLRLAGSATADAAGTAVLTVVVPTGKVPGWAGLQAAVARPTGAMKSNPLNAEVLP